MDANKNNLTPGQMFRFKPEFEDEGDGVFVVVEDRDDRVLCMAKMHLSWDVPPTSVALKSMIGEMLPSFGIGQ